MKKLFFLLILCLISINIYAQKDTIFCKQSETPVILSIPDGVCSPKATIKQNILVWKTKQPLVLKEETLSIEYKGLSSYERNIQSILIFDEYTQKNIVITKVLPKEKYFQKEIIVLFITIFVTVFGFLVLLIIKIKEVASIIAFFLLITPFLFYITSFWRFLIFENEATELMLPITATVLGIISAVLVFLFQKKKIMKVLKNEEDEENKDDIRLRGDYTEG